MDAVRRLADAVLYEGYILWPYRRSALKNQKRWTFGGVYPPAHSERHPDDRMLLQAQCLVEGGEGARVEVTTRFLQVVERRVARRTVDGLELVDELHVDGVRQLSWDEAVEREFSTRLRLEDGEARAAIDVQGSTEQEPLGAAGAIVRTWERLAGSLEVRTEKLEESLHLLTVRVTNDTPWGGSEREEALRRTFCSTHVVLRAESAAFVSQTDPPLELAEAAAAAENVGVWPVLVGEQGARDTMLAAPIILEDYAQIAPESPGDLFDAGEIDRLLILNVLSLTEAEQQEMRATDPRARDILDRCAALTPEELLPLHGAVRELRSAPTE
jgi:hydrogenase maturation protease